MEMIGNKHENEVKTEQIQSNFLISEQQNRNVEEDYSEIKHPTNYAESLVHFFKGNVGPGLFAMGDAFKNSGIVLGSILVPFLGLICLHCEHLLINASNHVRQELHLHRNPDFATTAELCFANAPIRIRFLGPYVRKSINLFLCLTQLGFCCVYFVFISRNFKQIMDYYSHEYSIHLHMAFILIPIMLCSLVSNLKYLTPLSSVANVCILYGIVVTLYYCCQKPFSHVESFAKPEQLPLSFGTVLFAFEGIGLVLPLQNEMKNPKQFNSPLGVLNVGLTVVAVLFSLVGIFSYWHYGDDIRGSVSLNLPAQDRLAQSVKFIIPMGVLLSFALQFYIPIKIMFPVIQSNLGPFRRPAVAEAIFRVIFVLITFTLAEVVPYLDLFISLVGAFCSTAIALIIPPILEFATRPKITFWMYTKNFLIIGIGLLGCATGSYESIRSIIKAFSERSN